MHIEKEHTPMNVLLPQTTDYKKKKSCHDSGSKPANSNQTTKTSTRTSKYSKIER